MELLTTGVPSHHKTQSLSSRWESLSKTRRCCFLAITVMILAILGLAIFLMVSGKKEKEAICLRKACPESEWENICLTRDCIESAEMILDSMDLEVDPCEDFHKFVCGGYLKRYSKIPEPNTPYWSSFMALGSEAKIAVRNMLEMKSVKTKSEAVRKMKKFYKSCMHSLSSDKASTDILLKEIERTGLGTWPDNLLTWKDSSFDLEATLSSLFAHEISAFIKAYTASTGFYVMLDSPPSLDDDQELEDYKVLLENTFTLMGIPGRDAMIASILHFERELNEVLSIRNETDDDEFYTPSELDQIYPMFNWTKMIKEVMKKAEIEPDSEKIKIKIRHNLTDLFTFLDNASPRATYNYLVWKFIEMSIDYLGRRFRKPKELVEFREKWNAEEGKVYPPRWRRCVDLTGKHFPRALTAEYAKVMFSKAMYNEIKSYLTAVKESFRRRLPLQTWLDQPSLLEIEEKLDNISVVLAYPPSLMDIKSLDKLHEMVQVQENNLLYNVLQLRKGSVRRALLSYLKDMKHARYWMYDPTNINAFNMLYRNEIVIPISILYPPYFQMNRQRYLNYAAIGSVLAHEMGHAFDETGILLSYSRNYTGGKWLGEEMTQAYMDRAKCYIDQYSQYIFREHSENSTLDGNLTLGDNIADNVGLWHSYLAYLEYEKKHGEEAGLPGLNFSNHQLFLIQYAQVECATYTPKGVELVYYDAHSPGEYRIIGTIVNMPKFGEIFNCPKGTPMNPYQKCELWV